MKGDDVQRIKQATERLSQAAHAARRGHATAPRRMPAASGAAGAQGEPDVVDAEFEEVDKRDRKAG